MAMFPVLQYNWHEDELYSEVIPQLAYGIEGMCEWERDTNVTHATVSIDKCITVI